MGEAADRRSEGWFPKSAIERMVTMPYPEDFTLFREDGSITEAVSPETAQAVIWEEAVITRKGRQYKKLVIDCDYEVGQVVKELSWEEFHPSAWYIGDDFVAWTVDPKPRKVGEALASANVRTAIHESVVD